METLKHQLAFVCLFVIASGFTIAFSFAGSLAWSAGETCTGIWALICACTVSIFTVGAHVGIRAFACTCGIGWCIGIGITTGAWLPLLLISTVVFLIIGFDIIRKELRGDISLA